MEFSSLKDILKDKKGTIQFILFITLFACAGANGMQIMVFCTVPLMMAILLERFFDINTSLLQNKVTYILLATMGTSTLFGMIWRNFIRRGVYTGAYATGYMTGISPVWEWMNRILILPEQWFTLLGVMEGVSPDGKLAGKDGIFLLLQILGVLLITVIPIIATVRYHKYQNQKMHILVWFHWVLTGIILCSSIIGKTGDANWRLTPIVMSATIVTGVYLSLCIKQVSAKRLVAVALAAIVSYNLVAAQNVFLPPSLPNKEPVYDLIQTLKENDLEYGFGYFWLTYETMLLSNSDIQIYAASVNEDGVFAGTYQCFTYWYDDTVQVDRWFVVLTNEEYEKYIESDIWENLYGDILQEEIKVNENIIVVFSENPITYVTK